MNRTRHEYEEKLSFFTSRASLLVAYIFIQAFPMARHTQSPVKCCTLCSMEQISSLREPKQSGRAKMQAHFSCIRSCLSRAPGLSERCWWSRRCQRNAQWQQRTNPVTWVQSHLFHTAGRVERTTGSCAFVCYFRLWSNILQFPSLCLWPCSAWL